MATRALTPDDWHDASALYRELADPVPVLEGEPARMRFNDLVAHPGTTVWGAEANGRVVAMATLHCLPNLTYSGRPYALVENVVTLAAHRGRGLGRLVMERAMAGAWEAGAYKIMLLTGTKRGARVFYERLGFRGHDKHAMTAWHDLPPEAAARLGTAA